MGGENNIPQRLRLKKTKQNKKKKENFADNEIDYNVFSSQQKRARILTYQRIRRVNTHFYRLSAASGRLKSIFHVPSEYLYPKARLQARTRTHVAFRYVERAP